MLPDLPLDDNDSDNIDDSTELYNPSNNSEDLADAADIVESQDPVDTSSPEFLESLDFSAVTQDTNDTQDIQFTPGTQDSQDSLDFQNTSGESDTQDSLDIQGAQDSQGFESLDINSLETPDSLPSETPFPSESDPLDSLDISANSDTQDPLDSLDFEENRLPELFSDIDFQPVDSSISQETVNFAQAQFQREFPPPGFRTAGTYWMA